MAYSCIFFLVRLVPFFLLFQFLLFTSRLAYILSQNFSFTQGSCRSPLSGSSPPPLLFTCIQYIPLSLRISSFSSFSLSLFLYVYTYPRLQASTVFSLLSLLLQNEIRTRRRKSEKETGLPVCLFFLLESTLLVQAFSLDLHRK